MKTKKGESIRTSTFSRDISEKYGESKISKYLHAQSAPLTQQISFFFGLCEAEILSRDMSSMIFKLGTLVPGPFLKSKAFTENF